MNAATARLPLPPLPQRPDAWALYLDFDGTLCPLAPHPDQVQVGDGLRQLLARLHRRLDGAVCILSGRPVHQLEALLGGVDGLTLVGCHGAEGLGITTEAGAQRQLAAARRALVRSTAGLGGVWIEDKPSGFALHYRANPEAAASLRRRVSRELARAQGLRAIEGACVMEVLPAGHSKGAALRALARQPRCDGRRPVAVGDDVTDEDAFAAAAELSGFGVCVGTRRPTVARYGLPCVTLARTWLQRLADAPEAA
jgi:trehalose 6-phosphate phosphatase